MLYLMNSAMMPKEGTFINKQISKNEFITLLKIFHKKGELLSYVGYPQNAELIEKWSGIKIPVNREQLTELNDGDLLLIMKLKYRLPDSSQKGQPVSEDDFEFYLCKYLSYIPEKMEIFK